MGKKRAAAVAAPVFPFPATDHFSDYGFDPQLVHFFSQPETKRPSTGRRYHHNQQAPPPLDSARFQLQKPISKKHPHRQHQQRRRRRWWSSAASAALLLFKRPSSSTSDPRAGAANPAVAAYSSSAVPLYFADDDDDGYGNDATAACACWASAMRSGHLAAAELGAASASLPYVSLRESSLGHAAAGGAAAPAPPPAPAMPIYLVT